MTLLAHEQAVYDKRQHDKKLRLAYRVVAGEVVNALGALDEGCKITVNERSNVQPAEDGAFIECIVWVPKQLGEEKVLELEAIRVAEELAKRCANGHVWSNDFGDDWKPEIGTPCDCGKRAWGTLEHGGD